MPKSDKGVFVNTKQMKSKYAATWGTPMGQDCINLDSSLCQWLGDRLVFLGTHTSSYSADYDTIEAWRNELTAHGRTLLDYADPEQLSHARNYAEARKSLIWVAMNLPALWD